MMKPVCGDFKERLSSCWLSTYRSGWKREVVLEKQLEPLPVSCKRKCHMFRLFKEKDCFYNQSISNRIQLCDHAFGKQSQLCDNESC